MLLSEFIRSSSRKLESLYPSPEARGMVLMLCTERLGVQSYTHIIEPSYAISEEGLAVLSSDMERLLSGEPIQYVLGKCDFYSGTFKVDSRVLIPRPETEILVSEALKVLSALPSGAGVLDLCTGSGCIAWTIAREVPDCRVVAVDISSDALCLASSQGFEGNAPEFVRADVLDTEQDFGYGPFDLIVSNPPYVMDSEKSGMRSNVLDWEPSLALFVENSDPLVFYRAVARWAQRFLKPGGTGMVEINALLGEETAAVFKEADFKNVLKIPDLSGKMRFVEFTK